MKARHERKKTEMKQNWVWDPQNLRILRKGKKLKLREFAEICDISLSEISRIERGLKIPTAKTIASFCSALNIEPNELFSISTIII